jgi:hypothetical protein
MTHSARSTAVPGTYRAALRVVEFDAIAGASLVSILGDSAAYLALTVLVYERTGSSLLSALTFTIGFLPYLIGGTLLSGLVDRFRPKTLLIGIDVIGALLLAITAAPGVPIPVIFMMLFLIGALAPVRSGTASALIAEILTGDTFVAGRSVQRICSQTAQIAGAGVGGGLVAAFGPRGALVADTASFLLSAAITTFLIKAHPIRGVASSRSLLTDSLAGIRSVWADPAVRRLLLLGWVVPFVAVAPEALAAPAVAQGGHHAAVVGLWMAAIPVGTVLGDLLIVWMVPPARRLSLTWPLAAVLTVLLILFAAGPPLWLAIFLLVLSGAASGYGLGLDQALRDTAAPAATARMWALNSTGLMVSQGLGFAAAGALGQLVSAHVAIAIAGVIGLACVARLAVTSRSAAT